MTARKFDGSDPDYSAEAAQERVDDSVKHIRAAAAGMDPGAPGWCKECDGHFQRLVRGVCARCRDRLKLP